MSHRQKAPRLKEDPKKEQNRPKIYCVFVDLCRVSRSADSRIGSDVLFNLGNCRRADHDVSRTRLVLLDAESTCLGSAEEGLDQSRYNLARKLGTSKIAAHIPSPSSPSYCITHG